MEKYNSVFRALYCMNQRSIRYGKSLSGKIFHPCIRKKMGPFLDGIRLFDNLITPFDELGENARRDCLAIVVS